MKTLKGRPRGKLEQSALDEEKFEDIDFDYPALPHERRPCRMQVRNAQYGDGDVNRVSQEKLLEASLQSLDTVTRRLAQTTFGSTASRGGGGGGEEDFDGHDSGDVTRGPYPSASYLRGALWLGRNLTLMTEEMAEAMERYRGTFLSEVADAGNDPDSRRACHRLTILAGAGVNQCCSFAGKAREATRELLQVRFFNRFVFPLTSSVLIGLLCAYGDRERRRWSLATRPSTNGIWAPCPLSRRWPMVDAPVSK